MTRFVQADCDTSACVVVESSLRGIRLWSTLEPDRSVILTRDEWAKWLADAKAGRFDQVAQDVR